MPSQSMHRRVARCAIGLGVLLAVSIAVGGCQYWLDESGQLVGPEQFCGYLYSCGNHGGSDRNRSSSSTATTSTSSGSSSTGSTSEETSTSEGE